MSTPTPDAGAMIEPTDEQLDFAAALRRALAETAPLGRTRGFTEAPDPVAWRALCALGLAALAVPERYDGLGAGGGDLALVAEELGRVLYNGPFLTSAVLATVLLRELDESEIVADLLTALATGERTATVLVDLTTAEPGTAGVTEHDGMLSGTVPYVLGADADALIVVAEDAHAYLVAPDATGLERTVLSSVDPLLPITRVTLRDCPGRRLDGDARHALATALAHAGVVLAAMQVGGAQRCLEQSVDYAKTRVQFGRVIGEFQAIKHKCANQLMRVESARSAAHHAAALIDSDDTAGVVARSLAAAYCSEAFVFCAAENIQIHGGMGFTWEHDAHLYFKRAHVTARMLGDATEHRAVIAEALDLVNGR